MNFKILSIYEYVFNNIFYCRKYCEIWYDLISLNENCKYMN